MGRLPSTQSPSPPLYTRATSLCPRQGSHVGIQFCWGHISVISFVLLCPNYCSWECLTVGKRGQPPAKEVSV